MKKSELKKVIKTMLVEESIGEIMTDKYGRPAGDMYADNWDYLLKKKRSMEVSYRKENNIPEPKSFTDNDVKITNNETREHILKVQSYMMNIIKDIANRSVKHDSSKLEDPEVSTFVEYTPKLKNSTYGSEEYNSFLTGMKPALDHHYEKNSHHPEHYVNGINGMDLLDLIEMMCDWKAASERHADGDVYKSIELNQNRFGYSDELKQIFINTISKLVKE